MANNRYSFRTKKIMANVKTDLYEFEDSMNETDPFSSGSSDEVHSSDLSLASDSSSDTNPGYLEVSKEKLCLKGLDPQNRARNVTDEKISDESILETYRLNEVRIENNEPANAMFNTHNSYFETDANVTQLINLNDMEMKTNIRTVPKSPIIPPQDKLLVTSQTLLDCNYVTSELNLNPNMSSPIKALKKQDKIVILDVKTFPAPNKNTENKITCSLIQNSLDQIPNSISKQTIINKHNNERVLHNYGIINEETPLNNVEQIENTRRWTKKNCCPYCFVEITHFPRHLQRNHPDERAVQDIFCLNFKDPKRKLLLDALRRQGNYLFTSNSKKTRPVRRPRSLQSDENYGACNYCLGYYKKTSLRKHRKKCPMIKKATSKTRVCHLSETQAFALCSGVYKEFYDSLRLKSEVIDKMRPDHISEAAIKDILICSYGESQLKRHRRVQLAVSVSNKIREMGRILLVLKNSSGINQLMDALKPEMFDNVVTATQVISGYDRLTHTFRAPSLALHMGTRLTQVCDIASQLIIKKNRFIDTTEPEKKLKNIKRFRALITNHWNTELSSIALKDLNEKNWEKPKLFPLTEDIIKFERFLTQRAEKNYNNIKQKVNIKVEYKNLTECVLALTLLLNRKRIGEVQYLKVKTYCNDVTKQINTDFLASLTPQEQMLSKNFKRVVAGGKGSKPIAILFPKKTQDLIQLMLEVRTDVVHPSNEYLFANPSTKDRWLSGYHVIKKLAEESGTSNKNLFTSTRLRKQIATILQVSNFSETDMEQFANFMGHTRKTHAEYYRLPQDVYQTAKVSKILMAINKGDSSQFKGKSFNDIKVSENDLVDSESDSDNESIGKINSLKTYIKKPTNTLTRDANTSGNNMTDNEEINITGPSRAKCEDKPTKKPLTRVRWSEEQKKIICKHFANHIKSQKPPKRNEVEDFKKEFKKLFKDRNWVVIKAFVYNAYRKNK